ncbi:MAG: HD domain-containing protein [Clostridiales bacterium]|nr:HD domain-containing protein [bacterium 210917-SL.2.15]MCI5842439.1 HD domain-containing protein [Clostridiales bacterium]MDY4036097.1 HD domain-containing protein [Candidatus Pseudoscilispira sp.]
MEYLSSLLCQATRLAAQAHDGAYRKGGKMPYLLHVMETAEIVGTMTEDEDVLAAAVLHDVLEDTSVTEEELRETVGGHVTELVLAVSENKRREQPAEATWRLRKQESVEKLLKEPRLEVKMIALGDKLSNIRALQRDYGILGEQVWERFNNKSKAEQGWYYQAVTDALQDLSVYPVWHELASLVWEVFWQDRDSDQLRFDLGQSRAERDMALLW